MKYWLYLAVAIGLEVCGTLSLKQSDGFKRLDWAAAMCVFYLLSFGCVAVAVKGISLSTSYAIWSGLGTAVIALVGILHYRESAHPLRLISIALIIVGVVGLKLAEGNQPPAEAGPNLMQTGAGT